MDVLSLIRSFVEAAYVLTIIGAILVVISENQKAGPFMSDFSSWGPTPELHLKPEISAHGGDKSVFEGDVAFFDAARAHIEHAAVFEYLVEISHDCIIAHKNVISKRRPRNQHCFSGVPPAAAAFLLFTIIVMRLPAKTHTQTTCVTAMPVSPI